MNRGPLRITLFAGWVIAISAAAVLAGDAQPVDYAKSIRPLLTARCGKCHGEQESQSGLRLDTMPAILRGGDRGPSLVPSNAANSLLFQAITGKGEITPMPAEAPRLPAKEIALIKRWIDEGAKGPADSLTPRDAKKDHWAFKPVRCPAPPVVRQNAWPRNGIDAFVLARLERERFAPSQEAARATLIRRVSLDLRGLPPSPEETAAFRDDRAPEAYERLVDRMFASPAYGERWGRHWLDEARYADSNGFTIDGPRAIWKYRDWVIRAINEDLSFDEFTTEQLAGDMLPRHSAEQVVATGFHRNTLVNEEGGTDKEQFRVEAVVDRVNTTGAVFLGLTVGCAQCHQHKFDPISQRDYYNLFALFNNCDEPTLKVPTREQARHLASLDRRIAETAKPLAAAERQFLAGLPAWDKTIAASPPVVWTPLDPAAVRTEKGTLLNPIGDRSLIVDFSVPANDTYFIECDVPAQQIAAVRLEALTHMSLPLKGPGRSDAAGNFVLSEIELRAKPLKPTSGAKATWQRIKLATAVADHAQDGFSAAQAIDGDRSTGWSVGTKVGSPNVDRELVVLPATPIHNAGGTRIEIALRHDYSEPNFLIGRLRLSIAAGPADALKIPNSIRSIAAIPAVKRTKAQKADLVSAFRETHLGQSPLAARVAALQAQKLSIERAIATTLVLRERKSPRESHVMIRGDFLRPGARVAGGVPAFLPPLAVKRKLPTRLDFARWLFDAANPLTARVTVNRTWQHFFGAGLVETENDFGTQGSPPTHPELLDWLANDLIRRHWSVKQLHRLIVTSATYRQSSALRPELMEHDPGNHLLARQSRVRLEAETVRDAALAASGLLSGKIGGPSVYPPQPEGIFVVTQQKKAWPESQGLDRFRRGMYTYYWRSSPYPMLPTFDAPEANTTCTRRTRSNTPLQALTLANDRAFVEIAQGLARRIVREGGKDIASRVKAAFRICFSREASDEEQTRLTRFVEAQRAYYLADVTALRKIAPKSSLGVASADGAAWTAGARVLLNLDEFITRE